MFRKSSIAAAGLLLVAAVPSAEAQFVQRVVHYNAPPTTFIQPAPVVQPMPVVQQVQYVQPATMVYRPVVQPRTTLVQPAPQTVYYAPQPVVVARPTIPVVPLAPAPVVTTRYRPILGGTVSRVYYP